MTLDDLTDLIESCPRRRSAKPSGWIARRVRQRTEYYTM